MKVMTPAVALVLAVSVSAGPAFANDNGTAEQQGDCMGDALAWCGQYIFAPDRNLKIGDCLWERRTDLRSVPLAPAPTKEASAEQRAPEAKVTCSALACDTYPALGRVAGYPGGTSPPRVVRSRP
jgi:hypothetical protein